MFAPSEFLDLEHTAHPKLFENQKYVWDALKQIAREAEENPEYVKAAPHTTRLQRLDETTAARKPILRWKAPVAGTPLEAESAAKEW